MVNFAGMAGGKPPRWGSHNYLKCDFLLILRRFVTVVNRSMDQSSSGMYYRIHTSYHGSIDGSSRWPGLYDYCATVLRLIRVLFLMNSTSLSKSGAFPPAFLMRLFKH